MATSPDIRNYQYGAGAVYIKVDDVDLDYRHVGNVPTLTYSSDITEVKHKQSMSGLKSVDDITITEVAATINTTLEEITPQNMALFVMGIFTEDSDGQWETYGLSQTTIRADFKYISANAKGANMELWCRVSIRPNGDFSFIQDGINTIQLQMEVLADDQGRFARWVFPPA